MAKNALVISGGGAKGAFAVGVIKYILANTPIKFDIICGTSTGSLIAPFAALEDVPTLEAVYTTTKTSDVILKGDLVKRFIKNNSFFDSTPLATLVKKYYTQQVFDQLTNSSKQVFFATVCLQTGKVQYFSNHDMPVTNGYDVIKLNDWDEFVRAIIASSDQPVFMPPIKIRSTDAQPRQYVDGGVREYAPIQIALDNGATDIYCIYLSTKDINVVNSEYTSIPDILFRTLALFSEDVGENDILLPELYNRSIIYLNDVKKKIQNNSGLTAQQIDSFFDLPNNPFRDKRLLNMHVFYPDYILPGVGGLDFDPVEMKKYVAHGEKIAKDYFTTGIVSPIIA